MKTSRSKRGTYLVELADGKTAEYDAVTKILGGGLPKPQLLGWATKLVQAQAIQVTAGVFSAGDGRPVGALTDEALATIKAQGRADRNESKKAMAVGSQVHHMIEAALRSEMQETTIDPPVPDMDYPEAHLAFARWKEWRARQDFKPLMVEQVVWSETHGYAGTLDLVAKYPSGLFVIFDWKVSSGIYPESLLQNAAYRCALYEMGHGPSPENMDGNRGCIVRLDKTENPDSEYDECWIDDKFDYQRDLEGFLSIKDAYQWAQAASKRLAESRAA